MSARKPLVVERLRHVPGELLRSRDLRDEVATEAELMWWHQRAVHDAAGILAGLTIESAARNRPVTVTPGIAYDARGRELVVAESITIDRVDAKSRPEPPVLALVLRRGHHGGVELAWLPLGRLGRCDGVPLARTDPKARRGLRPLAPRARRAARPRFAFGATQPGATAWSSWLELERTRIGLGLEVVVDTKPAGFTARPSYFAWLQWPAASVPGGRPGAAGFGIQHLADETAHGFTFRVMVVAPRALRQLEAFDPRMGRVDDADELVTYARAQRLSVAWVGLDDDHDLGGGA